MKCGTRDIIIPLRSSTKGIIHTIDSILIRIFNRSNPSSSSPKESTTLMKLMKSKVLDSLIIPTCQRIETFMESLVGSQTSMSSALKTMMQDISLIENISMAPWIITLLSTTLLWQTVNSSVRMPLQNQLLEKECKLYPYKTDQNMAALWDLLNQHSRLQSTQLPSF